MTKGSFHQDWGLGTFQAQGTASAKALRQKQVKLFQKLLGRSVWLNYNEKERNIGGEVGGIERKHIVFQRARARSLDFILSEKELHCGIYRKGWYDFYISKTSLGLLYGDKTDKGKSSSREATLDAITGARWRVFLTSIK